MNAKASLSWVAFVAFAVSTALPQGQIVFGNRNIPTASGTGGSNGNGTYNVPIWQSGNPTIGAGSLPGGVTVGLFKTDGTMLGTTVLRTDANSQFFATSAQTLTVPGFDAGTTPTLLVRAWTTSSGSFDAAKFNGGLYSEWPFITQPLGGTPVGGGTTYPVPGMTGWGNENGSGLLFGCLDCSPSAIIMLQPGFNLFANPLNTADNRVSSLFGTLEGGIPGGMTVYFLETNGVFSVTTWDDLDNRFVPADVAARSLDPGEGVFVYLPSSSEKRLTLFGSYPGQVCTAIPHGFSIKAGLGTPTYQINISPAPADTVYLFNTTLQNYSAYVYDDLGAQWSPGLPHPNASQAFLYYRAGGATTWCRTFNSP